MMVLELSLRNTVRGSGSSSGFQSSSRSRWIFSKRLGGFCAAPRWSEITCPGCTGQAYHTLQEASDSSDPVLQLAVVAGCAVTAVERTFLMADRNSLIVNGFGRQILFCCSRNFRVRSLMMSPV